MIIMVRNVMAAAGIEAVQEGSEVQNSYWPVLMSLVSAKLCRSDGVNR